jgi:hypothetical protein
LIPKRDPNQIVEDFILRRDRQVLAIAAALLLIVLLAVIHRSNLFGGLSKDTIFGIQVMVIAAFIGFTSANWRCPSCKKYLGTDINKHGCRKCGARFR